MQTENQTSKIKPADRLASVSERRNQPRNRQSRYASLGSNHTDPVPRNTKS